MTITRFRLTLALVALALAGTVLATAVVGAAATGKGTSIKLRKTALGQVLVDSRGFTLYVFEGDMNKTSACYGACAGFWPALVVKGKPTVAPGLKSALLGVTMRKNGAHQATYAGHPLYRFLLDKRAGQTKGEGLNDFGGHWFVVSAGGSKIEPNDSQASTSTTTTPNYGYGSSGGY